jgi:CubicO group peptidase (beta-lactamase class C family)
MQAMLARNRTPSYSLAVLRNGQVLVAKGYGLANVELSVPATEDTVYELASLTKQFTATAIMMIVQEGSRANASKFR